VANGQNTFAVPAHTEVGLSIFTASYIPANTYITGSTSNPININVTGYSQTRLSASSLTQISNHPTVQLTATVTVSAGVSNAGTLTFKRGNETFAVLPVINGQASFTVPGPVGVGLNSFYAVYAPTAQNVNGSSSSPVTVVVKGFSTLKVTANRLTQISNHPTVQLTATVTVSREVSNAGTITFKRGNQTFAVLPVINGRASFTVPGPVGIGLNSFYAVYTPQASNLVGSTSNTITVVVKGFSALKVTANSLTQISNHPTAQLTATVTVSRGVSNAGTITFKRGNETFAVLPVISGKATFTVPGPVGIGLNSFYAVYSPRASNLVGSTSNNITITVTP